jgi:hypothetical protein
VRVNTLVWREEEGERTSAINPTTLSLAASSFSSKVGASKMARMARTRASWDS